jgi:lysophospholipase L1-like esterase
METVGIQKEKPANASAVIPPVVERFVTFFTFLGYLVFSVVLTAMVLEIASRAILSAYQRFHRSTVAEFADDNPAYSPFSWAKECLEEQRVKSKQRHIYFPFRIWGVTEFHGSCINNDLTDLGAVRQTVNPPNPACSTNAKLNIWVLGGSTVYGTGIPDWATLPSNLARDLNSTARCVNLFNLGVEGYASNQEVLFLLEQLKAGKHPDIVVFYDGFNDADFGTMLPGNPTPHMGFLGIKGRLEGRLANRFDFLRGLGIWQLAEQTTKSLGRSGPPRAPASELSARANSALNNYEENLKIARHLGEAYGFKVYAFWQPAIIYGHKPLVAYEEQLLQLSLSPAYPFQSLQPVYKEAQRRASVDGTFVFLGNIFDAIQEPLYLDWAHLNPRGNEIAAHALASYINEHSK